ncbi:hypothetical protein SAMN03097699_3296 [Flavobacteriaceae bacterium MAR_2010_188]|nr:hypothetical protein SAMN03097699_3296 [Flavobacteriaceae bacterium MAR_2010_188]
MKFTILIFSLLITALAISQNNLAMEMRNDKDAVLGSQTMGVSMRIVNPARETDGSVYLFDKWENLIYIVTDQGDKMQLDNINLNVDKNVFESRFGGDSIFSFNFNNIDRFLVNNKEYKNYFWKDDNRVYQVLAETDDFSVLKGFSVSFVEGSVDPMLNRSRDRYVMKERYYIKRENSIKPFALRKGSVLKLFADDKSKKSAIKQFVKDKNLSFNDEEDIDKIISYAMSI